jgi:hypothetical protein
MFDVFYLDKPTGLFPHEQSADSIVDAATKSRTRYYWIVNYLCDYTGFDFLYQPLPHQTTQAHVWPSQHQQNSGTWLIPRTPGAVEINRDHPPVLRNKSAPRVHIKHSPNSENAGDYNTRYIDSYLGTMRRALSKVTEEYCWVTADVCDYTGFDFTWHPSEWQADMLHVFASDEEKFGDTFYVHVSSFLEKTQNLRVLEWFETLHFVEGIHVPRLPMPTVKYTTDSVVPAVWAHEFTSPLVQFYRDQIVFEPTVPLWQESTKTVVPLTRGAGSIVVPRECKNYLKTQIYDYPYINKSVREHRSDPSLDIIFVSNGETNAEYNWNKLKTTVSHSHNRITRVDGVKGRVASQHAAANASLTDWYFVIPAKLQIDFGFDWSWQPDRMQQPKHYIFHALNPINGLVYGHMAAVAYNKKLVLETTGQGLDFTLDQPHEVIPELSGTAHYGEDPWMCWRTAFREVIKLKSSLHDIESKYRLDRWLTVADVVSNPNSAWSIYGAEDAVEYYDAVNGDFFELKKSYEWNWLASYALIKRGLSPG